MSDCTLSSFGGWFNTHTEEVRLVMQAARLRERDTVHEELRFWLTGSRCGLASRVQQWPGPRAALYCDGLQVVRCAVPRKCTQRDATMLTVYCITDDCASGSQAERIRC